MREAFGRVMTIAAFGESPPSTGSVIDLDLDRKDASGLKDSEPAKRKSL